MSKTEIVVHVRKLAGWSYWIQLVKVSCCLSACLKSGPRLTWLSLNTYRVLFEVCSNLQIGRIQVGVEAFCMAEEVN